jgi:hypothetical protein
MSGWGSRLGFFHIMSGSKTAQIRLSHCTWSMRAVPLLLLGKHVFRLDPMRSQLVATAEQTRN